MPKILIIEDEAAIRRVLTKSLRRKTMPMRLMRLKMEH